MFIGSTLQIDLDGNSSTATLDRITGFGGAPNMGSDPHGRRHASPAWASVNAPAVMRPWPAPVRPRRALARAVSRRPTPSPRRPLRPFASPWRQP
jgi:malonate decarboxylase alpha subunit